MKAIIGAVKIEHDFGGWLTDVLARAARQLGGEPAELDDIVRARRYRDAHQEGVRERARRYRQVHQEEVRERSGRYRDAHQETIRERDRHYDAARQAQTVDEARRNGYVWTGPDLEIAARDDLTVTQIALMLGRTYSAVRHARERIRDDPRASFLAGIAAEPDELLREGRQ